MSQALADQAPISILLATNNNYTINSLKTITKALPSAHLYSIGISAKDYYGQPGDMVNFLAALKTQDELLVLDLRGIRLSYSGLSELSELIGKLPKLQNLYLDNTRLSDESFRVLLPAIAKSNINLLSLRENPLNLQSVEALVIQTPRSLLQLNLANTNLTADSAIHLGSLIQRVNIEEIILANNNLGNNFTEIFVPYLPGSNLKRLDLENCNFVGSAAARDLREVLTSAQIPDDWLGNLDTSTLRSIATGNPGTNLSWINLANNQLDDIGITVLCQILPGTEFRLITFC